MLTVLEAIKLATEYFDKKQIESSRINAELLLADILKCKRLDLYLKFDQPLKEDEVNKYREFIARRGKYEPLQYITGSVEFFGLNFKVNPSVLIPRPETEILVETIINQNKERTGLTILDVGTGSGNIPIVLAKFLPQSKIVTIDVSDESINVAKENAELNQVNGNVEFVNRDVFVESFFENLNFDIIVSNPPYVSIEEYPSLQEEIVNYEPKYAVTDEEDGLKFYNRISQIAFKSLNEGGKLYFEIGQGQSKDINDILNQNKFSEIQIIKDYQNIDRVIYGTKK